MINRIKRDYLISKLRLKFKLKDRKHIKGFNFSFNKSDSSFYSNSAKEYGEKRKQNKLLNEKEINKFMYYLNKLRKERIKIVGKDKNEKKEINENSYNMSNENSFNIDNICKFKMFERKRKEKKDKEKYNTKINKIKIVSLKNSYCKDIEKIFNNIKEKSNNFYKVMAKSNIRQKILEKDDLKNYKFYKDFFNSFTNFKKSTSISNLNQKSLFKYNTPILNLNKTSIDYKNISNKSSDSFYNQIEKIKSPTNSPIKPKIKNLTLLKKYFLNRSLRPSTSTTIIKKEKEKKISILKKNFVKNKPIYTTNMKYFIENFKKIKDKVNKNKMKSKERHFSTYSNIEKFSKIREDMLMFSLKMKYNNTRFPPEKTKVINKRKILFHKLKDNFDEQIYSNVLSYKNLII